MVPLSTAAFERAIRGLSARGRVAFVADVYAARGWTTSVEDGVIVAEMADQTRRIRVADPGRFGVPGMAGVDTLVVAHDREAVREAADAAGVDYVAPAALRDLLLYGLDREVATALFEGHVGTPLLVPPGEADGGVPEPPLSRLAAAVPAISTRATPRRLAVVLALVLFVGFAVAGPGIVPGTNSAPTTPELTGTFTPDETGAIGADGTDEAPPETVRDDSASPPGIGPSSIEDVAALGDAHVDALGDRAYVLRVAGEGPKSDPLVMRGRSAWNYTVRVETPRHYRYDGRFVFPSRTGANETRVARIDIYADGEDKYRRHIDRNVTSYRRYAIATTDDASGYAEDVRQSLVLFMPPGPAAVECVARLDSDACLAYEVTVTEPPMALPDAAAEYRARAIVDEHGMVHSLQVRYTLPDGDGSRELVRFSLTYEQLGDVTVSTPSWLDEAKRATSTTRTETP